MYTTYIRSTREQVWAALTTPEFTTKYWNGRVVESDWRAGSPVTVRHDYDDGIDFTGTVTEASEPRRLSYRFAGPDRERSGTLTFELTPHGEVVALTVTHEGLSPTEYASAGGGWSFILSNLKTLLESGTTLPMPDAVLAAYR